MPSKRWGRLTGTLYKYLYRCTRVCFGRTVDGGLTLGGQVGDACPDLVDLGLEDGGRRFPKDRESGRSTRGPCRGGPGRPWRRSSCPRPGTHCRSPATQSKKRAIHHRRLASYLVAKFQLPLVGVAGYRSAPCRGERRRQGRSRSDLRTSDVPAQRGSSPKRVLKSLTPLSALLLVSLADANANARSDDSSMATCALTPDGFRCLLAPQHLNRIDPHRPARRQHAGERYDCEKHHTNAAQHKRIDRLDLEQQVPY